MSSIYTFFADISPIRQRVLASGVSLLFAYTINFVFQAFFLWKYKQEKNVYAFNKLTQTSRLLYLFGVASVFSIYPPYYYGVHCAILSWFTLIVFFILHIFTVLDSTIRERSLWSIFYVIFHFMIALWIFVTLIIAYKEATNDEKMQTPLTAPLL